MPFSDPMVNLFVQDLDTSLAFYSRLGFEEVFRAPSAEAPDHVELELSGIRLAVSTAEAAERVHGLPARPGSGGFELVVWSDDVDAAYDALVAAGVPTHTAPHDTGNDNRNAVVLDPDGNLVELVSKRG